MHSLASRDNYFVSFWRIRSEAFSLEAGSPARPVRGASPFIVRHLDEQFLLRSGCVRAPRNLITSCGDRIALTKSSKGGVKARAQRENRRRQSPSSWTTFSLQPLLSVFFVFSIIPCDRFIPRVALSLLAIPCFRPRGERDREREKRETQFSTDNKKQSIT